MRDDYRSRVLNRWKSIQGHAEGIRKMIENDEYCPEIIKQTLAVQGAIDSVNSLILENHLHTCATTAIRGDDPAERERAIDELLDVFRTARHVTWNRNLQPLATSTPKDGGPDAEMEDQIA